MEHLPIPYQENRTTVDADYSYQSLQSEQLDIILTLSDVFGSKQIKQLKIRSSKVAFSVNQNW